jgi:flavin-dependent dehydrogenase
MSTGAGLDYDVIIMGGGPAGSTLGALLTKRTNLSVAIFEKEKMPREHIGESFAHQMVPVLQESGALEKVLATDCWVKKFGGIFNWGETPMVAFFDHQNMLQDGVHRFAMHVNRAEFDQILLEHAASLGVSVFEETAVNQLTADQTGCTVSLKNGKTVRGAYFVDASGRRNSIAAKEKRQWLSGYRNIAIWQHFVGGKPAQELAGDWNIFREPNLSPIGCFAFQDGWCWYIPVPRIIDGKRVRTHSVGIVTIPEILKQDGCDFTDQATFVETVKKVPYLCDLLDEAEPVDEKMLTATNYSMINNRFADLDERWILVGDASYFVDPLFSSGVAFATNQAASAALLLEQTLTAGLDDQAKRDIWRDYDEGWHGMAETFALSIDQWYHALGRSNPDSVYWRHRGFGPDLEIHERTFNVLLNTSVTPNLMQVITGASPQALAAGPLTRAIDRAEPAPLAADVPLRLAPGVVVRETIALDVPGFKAFTPEPPFDDHVDEDARKSFAHYWADPVANGDTVVSPTAAPVQAYRFAFAGQTEGNEVRGLAREGTEELLSLLQEGTTTEQQLTEKLTPAQLQLFKRLSKAGMVVGTESGQS